MTNSEQIQDVIAAAERAAEAGDYALAQRHLRVVVALQEGEHGPMHPELANTLNNLGVACERAGKLDEAETAYRRACAVALKAFPPDDPLVLRSAENLRDFCAARGRPLDVPELDEPDPVVVPAEPPRPGPPPRTAAPPAPADPLVVPPPPVQPPAPRPVATPVAPASSGRSIVPLVACVVVVVAAAAWWWTSRAVPDPGVAPSSTSSTASIDAADGVAAPPVRMEPEPVEAVNDAPEASAPADATPPADPLPPPDVAPAPAPIAANDDDMVAAAEVCQSFRPTGDPWQCDPVAGTVAPGRALVYYTRVRSPRAVTIEHRWFRDDILVQRVELSVGSNRGAGYRTYSRQTASAGAWRVELRHGNDALHEARFTVR